MERRDKMMVAAMDAEARAASVWADASASAQDKASAAWEAACARQQSDDMEAR